MIELSTITDFLITAVLSSRLGKSRVFPSLLPEGMNGKFPTLPAPILHYWYSPGSKTRSQFYNLSPVRARQARFQVLLIDSPSINNRYRKAWSFCDHIRHNWTQRIALVELVAGGDCCEPSAIERIESHTHLKSEVNPKRMNERR
jgi:hypothetical protein